MRAIIKSFLLLLILVALWTPCESKKSYCSKELCGSKKHIACKNNGKFAKRCPSNAKLVGMKTLRATVLHQHNRYRNIIAGGKFSHFKAARRMAPMRWSKQLARMASFNVKQCRMKHDKCRNTFKFRYSGQNLVLRSWSGNKKRNRKATSRYLIGRFFAEHKNTPWSTIKKYTPSKGKQNGHFTVMMSEKNTHVGCAIAEYYKSGKTTFLMACNYARTNIVGKPVYRVGKAGSKCKKGKHKKYKNLCSLKEKYRVNVN